MNPPEATTPAYDIDTNRVLLNRYRYVHQEWMRLLAGWLPRTAHFELKCEFGRLVWENAQHVNALYLRLREIQSPAFQKPADPALVRLMEEMIHAPSEVALAAALHRVILPDLVAALAAHETATFPNSDQPSVYAVQHILLDLRAQQARLQAIFAGLDSAPLAAPEITGWEWHVRALLAAAGGIAGRANRGPAPAESEWRTEFVLPREAARDRRFTQLGADAEPAPPEEEYERHTLEEFERYSTEMLAAETVAVVMFRTEGMPWEFYHDTARHLYDQVRHGLMGFEWMQRHGLNPFTAPQYLHIFRWRSQFDPVMQYCLLTMGNEVHAFSYRHRRVEEHAKSGDRLSEQFVRYDIADETQHVRFGKRWLPRLLEHTGELRSLETYVADVIKVWEAEYRTGKLTLQVE